MAIQCTVNEDLKTEWEKYLEQTANHVEIVRDLLQKLGLDPEAETPGRQVVRHIGQSLVKAMEMAKQAGKEVEDEEDKHLYHTKGWSRELWMQSMGFPAVIPPPEEKKGVKTAIGAARAQQSRSEML